MLGLCASILIFFIDASTYASAVDIREGAGPIGGIYRLPELIVHSNRSYLLKGGETALECRLSRVHPGDWPNVTLDRVIWVRTTPHTRIISHTDITLTIPAQRWLPNRGGPLLCPSELSLHRGLPPLSFPTLSHRRKTHPPPGPLPRRGRLPVLCHRPQHPAHSQPLTTIPSRRKYQAGVGPIKTAEGKDHEVRALPVGDNKGPARSGGPTAMSGPAGCDPRPAGGVVREARP